MCITTSLWSKALYLIDKVKALNSVQATDSTLMQHKLDTPTRTSNITTRLIEKGLYRNQKPHMQRESNSPINQIKWLLTRQGSDLPKPAFWQQPILDSSCTSQGLNQSHRQEAQQT